MATKKMEVRWPTAAVLIAFLVCVTLVYVVVPEHRSEVLAGLAFLGPVLLGFMRRVLAPAAVVMLAIAIPVGATGCGSASVPEATLRAARATCTVVEPVCRTAIAACDVVESSGGESTVTP